VDPGDHNAGDEAVDVDVVLLIRQIPDTPSDSVGALGGSSRLAERGFEQPVRIVREGVLSYTGKVPKATLQLLMHIDQPVSLGCQSICKLPALVSRLQGFQNRALLLRRTRQQLVDKCFRRGL
jgi:hypothetical protein